MLRLSRHQLLTTTLRNSAKETIQFHLECYLFPKAFVMLYTLIKHGFLTNQSARRVLSEFNIHLFQKTLSERTANGSCRTEIARPKGTVVATFGMQKQCVLHVALN